MEGRSDTTAREDSRVENPPCNLALEWVWPRSARVLLSPGTSIVGRGERAAVQVGGSGASREHAKIACSGPLYVLTDLGSTNGTWLDGNRIEQTPLRVGQVLRVGEWVGVLVRSTCDQPAFEELAPGLLGGPELALQLARIERAAPSTLPIVLVGETGTGKECLATAAHRASGRRGRFFAVNCAAIPKHLAEAELFGYRRGAFTGADRSSSGYFRAAHEGTLFLDELPELDLELQAKLLRVLEDGKVLGLGEATSTHVDVRIISAGQQPLAELVEQGRVRRDLAARLEGLEVLVPRLAQRRADIVPLFRAFLARHSGGHLPTVETRLVEALCLHDWPENVRGLERLTHRLVVEHAHEGCLKRSHLPASFDKAVPVAIQQSGRPATPDEQRARAEQDTARLRQELQTNGGNVRAASRALGISRQRIYRLLQLEPSPRLMIDSGPNGSVD
jgi:two-component system, NtrC family, nitrogen regulation response regulator NtrX